MNNQSENAADAQKYYLRFAVFIAFAAGLISQNLCYFHNYNYAYRDAIFRMEAARRFFDSATPGIINQIGTVWLPVPNLILMPLAHIDHFWQTGLAASIINFPSFVICSIFVFLALKKLTTSPLAAWFGFLMFVFNYNILYFQTTPMTEQIYLTFLISSFYFLLSWAMENNLKHLVFSSILMMLSVGTRYDAWPVAVVSAFVVLMVCVMKRNKPVEHALIYGMLPLLFMIGWLIYNWIRYGDPLEFSRGQFSTLYQLKYYEDAGRLLTKGNLHLSAKVYFGSVLLYSGVIYSIIALAGLIVFVIKQRLSSAALPVYSLLVALPTTLFLLYTGQLIIEIPDSVPPGFFNSRYGLYLFPAAVIFSGIAASYLLKYKWTKYLFLILVAAFAFQQAKFLEDFPENIPAIAEAKYQFSETSKNLSWFLKNNYTGGKVLYDNLIFAIYPWTRIDLVDRITFHTYEYGEKAMNKPSEYVNWILIYKEAPNDKIYEAMKNNPDFLNNFEVKFSEYGVEAYRKKP